MPRLLEAKKDAQSCEKLRGVAKTLRSAGIRMGQPGVAIHHLSDQRHTWGTETSKYPQEEKTTDRKVIVIP